MREQDKNAIENKRGKHWVLTAVSLRKTAVFFKGDHNSTCAQVKAVQGKPAPIFFLSLFELGQLVVINIKTAR